MEQSQSHKKVVKMVMVGLMAALVVVGSAIRITVPSVVGTTSFHLGNIMCALAGIVLGPVGGGLASAIGSAIYDMTNPLYISEAWITFLTKGAYGLAAGAVAWSGGQQGRSYRRNLLGTTAGAVAYALLYLFKSVTWSGMLIKGLPLEGALVATAAKLPATTFNAVVAIVAAPVLASAIQKALGAAGKKE